MINIVLITDNNYVKYTAISITSIIKNNIPEINIINPKKTEKLSVVNIDNGGNTKQLFEMIEHYPAINKICCEDTMNGE